MHTLRDSYDKPSPAQHHVLLALALRLGSDGTGYASMVRLSEDTGRSRTTVWRALRWAQDHGWLEQTRRGHRLNNEKTAASEWRLVQRSSRETLGRGANVSVEPANVSPGVSQENHYKRTAAGTALRQITPGWPTRVGATPDHEPASVESSAPSEPGPEERAPAPGEGQGAARSEDRAPITAPWEEESMASPADTDPSTALVALGLDPSKAEELAAEYPAERVLAVVRSAQRPTIQSPVGWAIGALEGGWAAPTAEPEPLALCASCDSPPDDHSYGCPVEYPDLPPHPLNAAHRQRQAQVV